MRYLILCACLVLTFGKEILTSPLKETKNSDNQLNLQLKTSTPIKRDVNNVVLDIHEHKTYEPLYIRARIPQDLVIPTTNNFGLSNQIRISPIQVESYPPDTLSGIQFGNNFPSIDFGRQLPSPTVGSRVITIPAQQSDSFPEFAKALKFDTSFTQLTQIGSLNPIVNFSPHSSKPNSFSIQQAISVEKFDFSKERNFKFSTHNPASISDDLNIFNNNINKENKSPTKTSYSIQQVPEVASVHKTGPLIPSDIPSIPELLKIFDTKPTKVSSVPSVPETTTIHEKSDEEILELIQHRIAPTGHSREESNRSLDLEKNTQTYEDSIENRSSISESSDNDTESENDSVGNDLDQILNTTEEAILDNSTGIPIFRSAEDDDTIELDKPESFSNITNTSADNSQEQYLSNETVVLGTLTSITKLNASNFLNQNDILKDTPKLDKLESFSNITNTSEDNSQEELLLSNETVVPVTPVSVTKLNASDFLNANDILKDTSKLDKPESFSNITNTSEDNSQELLLSNETVVPVTPVSVTKLNASDFLNANDILKDTPKLDKPESFSNITNTSEDNSQELLLSNETVVPVTPVSVTKLNASDFLNANDILKDTPKLDKPESFSNITNTCEDNSQEQLLLNETVVPVTPVSVTKLNASDFLNANDILKDTPDFKAIVEPSKVETNSSQNNTAETETPKSENITVSELAKPLDLSDNTELSNISSALINTSYSQVVISVVPSDENNDNLSKKNETSIAATSLENTDLIVDKSNKSKFGTFESSSEYNTINLHLEDDKEVDKSLKQNIVESRIADINNQVDPVGKETNIDSLSVLNEEKSTELDKEFTTTESITLSTILNDDRTQTDETEITSISQTTLEPEITTLFNTSILNK